MSDLPSGEVEATPAGRTLFIINPAGHGGTGTTTWEQFQACWSQPISPADAIVTQRPGHARDIAFSAEGYDTLTAVGGDGTVGDVMSGILDRPGDRPQLAIVPGGTGNDIARNVGVHSIPEAARAMREGQLRAFDMMRVEYRDGAQPRNRYAFLLTAVGFSSIPMIRPWMKRFPGAERGVLPGDVSPDHTLSAAPNDGQSRWPRRFWTSMEICSERLRPVSRSAPGHSGF